MTNLATQDITSIVAAGVIGQAVGDALGVPVEFQSRESLRRNCVLGMRSGGSHNQPAGTWSDDTSLTLCLAESLSEVGIDYHDQARRFVGWLLRSEWTPHGKVFDVGNATRNAIYRLHAGVDPTEAGPSGEFDCGNGSLMRILPVALYLASSDPSLRIETAMKCSRLTHGHPRCQIACAMFVETATALIQQSNIKDAVALAQSRIEPILRSRYPSEISTFARILRPGIEQLEEMDISGSGYVIHSLESSLWCALRAGDYAGGVLAAVNLGEDTDTTGAVTGALLGLRFGIDAIPADWSAALARRTDVLTLCDRFQQACERRWELDHDHT